MTDIIGHQYIGGARSAAGTIPLQSHDASTGEALPFSFSQASAEEVDAAAQAVAAAYPAFRNLPASRRADFLEAIATQLDALDDEFIALITRETALPTARIQGERGRTCGQMRLFAQVLRRGDFYGARIDLPCPHACRCHGSICVSTGSASVRLRCSAPAISRWHSPPPVAIPLPPSPPAAPWCSKRTATHGNCGACGRCNHSCRRASRHA